MLIGREKEQEVLRRALKSPESEMIAVIGRRRIGKTYLINSIYGDKIRFETSGVQNAGLKEQLNNFNFNLKKSFGALAPAKTPRTWQEAFFALINCLEESSSVYQTVLFFDELPWLAARKSGFLNALSFFWNSWAVKKNVKVVICGSAASWMIQKVINDKGGLHNRITKRIDLKPFTLAETEDFLKDRNLRFERHQILQLYMALGGIPHYLNEVVGGKSALQNIEDICFAPSGLLNKEFLRLYPALFDNSDNHIAIIRALAQKWSGMTRLDILAATGLADGGGTSLCLEELESSGFISSYPSLEKKRKELVFRLTDEYSLFYLRFIENHNIQGIDTWKHLSQTQTYKSWSGYAFENICLKHISQIRKAMGISGIYSEASTFYHKGQDGMPGVQIDLILDRNDNCISLFEIKYHAEPLVLSQAMANDLRQKSALFKHYTKTRKQVFLSMIVAYGIIENEHSLGLIDSILTLDSLFDS